MRTVAVAVAVAIAIALPVAAAADPIADGAAALAHAVTGGKSGAVRKLFAAKVQIDGLAFDDATCAKAFGGGSRTVARKQQAKLAACLAAATWAPRQIPEVFDDTAVLDPGDRMIRVRFAVVGGTARIDAITSAWYEVDDADGEGDPNGVPGGVLGGADVPPPPPPPPPSPPQIVSPTALEANRLTGDPLITPDDATKKAIEKSGKDRIVASLKLCINPSGKVVLTKLLKTTGFPDYDNKLVTGAQTWTYKPYLVNGKALPVCSAVTFIYSQK